MENFEVEWEDGLKSKDPNRLTKYTEGWKYGLPGDTKAVSDGSILYFGKTLPTMKAVEARGKRSVIANTIRHAKKIRRIGKWVEVKLHSYQKEQEKPLELVWLADKTQDFMVPVAPYYIDFILKRFPKAVFIARDNESLIQIRRRKAISSGIAGYLMPLDANKVNPFKFPKMIDKKKWEEKFEDF